MKRLLSALLCVLLIAGMSTGCGGSGGDKAEYSPGSAAELDYAYTDNESKTESLTTGTELDSQLPDDRKLIKIVRLTAETEAFDTLMDSLNQQITALGGYVESRETGSYRQRSCSMTIRIPADNLSRFVEHVTTNANVTNSSESAQDVTLEYVDTEAKIKALETEQNRLLELLAEAEDLSSILLIEERLSEVTYELERYASRLRSLANQVDYATVYLNLYEVKVLTPNEDPTVWQRISTGFRGTLEDLGENITNIFVWVIVESPNLVLLAVMAGALTLLLRKVVMRNRKKNIPTAEDPE